MTYLFSKPEDGEEYVESFIEDCEGERRKVFYHKSKEFVISQYLKAVSQTSQMIELGFEVTSPKMPEELKTWLAAEDLKVWDIFRKTFYTELPEDVQEKEALIEEREEAKLEFERQCTLLSLDYEAILSQE